MRIAIFTSSFFPEVNGVTVTLMERLKRLSLTEHSAIVFCPDYKEVHDIFPNWEDYKGKIFPNIEVIHLPSKPYFGLKQHRTLKVLNYSEIKKKLDFFQPDIIESEDMEQLFFGNLMRDFAAKYAFKENIPSVAIYHTHYLKYIEDNKEYMPILKLPFIKNFFIRSIVNGFTKYDFVISASKDTIKYCRSLGIRNIFFQNILGIDIDHFNPRFKKNNFWEKFGKADFNNKVKLLSVGRFTADKGWKFFWESFQHLQNYVEIDNIALIIVGNGTLEKEIKENLKFLKNVLFLGELPNNELNYVYSNSDIYLTASENETKGMTILEASASGIPSIAPNAGGVAEIIQDEKTGFLFEPKNKKDFLSAISFLINNRDLRISFGSNAKLFVESYSLDKTFCNWISMLESISL